MKYFTSGIEFVFKFYSTALVKATDHDTARDFTTVKQSLTVDDRLAEFAVNGDPQSCAQTKPGGIWMLDLGSNRMISSFQVIG